MNEMTTFFTKCLDKEKRWTDKAQPTKDYVIYYNNGIPIIGSNTLDYEVYQEIDYVLFLELKKHFPSCQDYYYQAVRFTLCPKLESSAVEGVYLTREKTIDQTIIHLVSAFSDKDKLDALLAEIKKKYSDYYIGSIYQSIEQKLVEILYQKKLKISFAESCTGGMLASSLVNVFGASEVIGRSYVTYSNEAKNEILGVDAKLIKKAGVVSAEVAERMAVGLAKISKADVNVSVTGYAGGDQDNPNDGLFYFAIHYHDYINIERHHFSGKRNEVRTKMKSYILWRIGQLLTLKP